MDIHIRPVKPSDKSSLDSLIEKISQFKSADVSVASELIEECLKSGVESGYYILVAEDGQSIAGYICYGPTPLTESTWDIYWEAVSPTRQGQGIGTALLKRAENDICLKEGTLILIETSSLPGYENTRKFYKFHGYRKICCIPDFYSQGDDRLTYCKKL